MPNFKITIQYDGTSYKGWQILSDRSDTIQGKLQDILSRLVPSAVIIGSGRTDAGVHAIGQVANFHMTLPQGMSAEDLLLYINKYLPEDIAVTSIEEVDERFHARYSAKSKTYRYRIHVSPISNPFEKRFVYHYQNREHPENQSLDVAAMRQAASLLVGTHDFMAFCGNKHMKKSTVRTIDSIEISEIYEKSPNSLGSQSTPEKCALKELQIDYTGDGFLQNQIRIMTGTLIEIGTHRRAADDISVILESRDRASAGYTAPPQGLCLMRVKY